MSHPPYVGNSALTLVILFVLLLLILVLYNQSRKYANLPPGPPPGFFTGNSHQVPSSEPWRAYANWSRLYASPLIYLRISNNPTIVLNSAKAAVDLLDARSNLYSDRPHPSASPAARILQNASFLSVIIWPFSWLPLSTPRGSTGYRPSVFSTSILDPRFNKYRRLLQTSLNLRAIRKYNNIMEEERLVLLRGLLQQPDDFFQHVRRNAGAVILKVAYGWQVTSNDDYFVQLMEEGFKIRNAMSKHVIRLDQYLPILRHLPAWLPGNSYKRKEVYFKKHIWKVDNVPHLWVKQQMQSGNAANSFSSQHLQPQDGHVVDAEEEDIIRRAAGALYIGGADTTVSAVLSFILLMVLYPDVQRRAQDEIDRVVGRDRLPTLEDQEKLIYVNALIKEVLRFAPVVPLGLPHRAMEEDTYIGKRIPKGATVIANIWAIAHDKEVYDHSFTFDPTRFLEAPESENGARIDPRKLVFGYGRRVCPGMHFAEMAIFLNISGMLALYNIGRSTNEQGQEIIPPFEMTTGITMHPKPFQCRIVPRRPNVMAYLSSSDQPGVSSIEGQLAGLRNVVDENSSMYA